LLLSENSRKQSGPIHKCKICYKTYVIDVRLKKHVTVHAGNDTKPLECLKDHVYEHREMVFSLVLIVKKIFKEYPSIRKHIKAFHSEKRFACTNCEKSFIWQVMK